MPDERLLRRLWQEEHLTQAEIGSRFGASAPTARRWLIAAGIPLVGGRFARFIPASREAFIELYDRQKLSTPEIAQKMGVSVASVQRRLHHYGIKPRSGEEAAKLAYLQGKLAHLAKRELTPAGRARIRAALQKGTDYFAQHPEARRAGGIASSRKLNWSKRGQWLPCWWCGQKLYRQRCHCNRYTMTVCDQSHKALSFNWRRWHPNEPRPLILERLRQGEDAKEIGATDIEIRALQSESLQAVEPRPLPAPRQSPEKPAQPRKKALKPEEIGPLGEALLRAVRKE